MSGQTGFSPVPKYIIVAVAAHATDASTTLSNLSPNAIDIPPERPAAKRAKLFCIHLHPAAKIQHHQALE
jgi:hypothetical protein